LVKTESLFCPKVRRSEGLLLSIILEGDSFPVCPRREDPKERGLSDPKGPEQAGSVLSVFVFYR